MTKEKANLSLDWKKKRENIGKRELIGTVAGEG